MTGVRTPRYCIHMQTPRRLPAAPITQVRRIPAAPRTVVRPIPRAPRSTVRPVPRTVVRKEF